MDDKLLTSLATILLVIVGAAQVAVLISQKRQTRIALIAEYRNQWSKCKEFWGKVIFIGRNPDYYYQVLDKKDLSLLNEESLKHRYDTPTVWALESIQKVCGTLGEVSIRILQGHLKISDAYPIFGTEFLRHNNPLRILLDNNYEANYRRDELNDGHYAIRNELQDWLIYHDGLRRRCLILIDLLWAEAARLEDLPPDDMMNAAEAKAKSGSMNRSRIFNETLRLNGIFSILSAYRLSLFLGRSEYRNSWNPFGIRKRRLQELQENWTNRLLRR